MRLEIGGRRQHLIGLNHGFDVVVERYHQLWLIERMKPNRLAIKHQHGHIRQRAWPQTTAHIQMDNIAQLAAFPFMLVNFGPNRGKTTLGNPTAAAMSADKQHAAFITSVDHAPIDALDHIALQTFSH